MYWSVLHMDTERSQRTEWTRVQRLPERAAQDRATVTLVDGLVLARSAFHHCKDGLSTAAREAA
jgi:hypothetical protein